MKFSRTSVRLASALLLVSCVVGESFAASIYVNNLGGDDTADGRSDTVLSVQSGPVRSIRRALRIAKPGDVIVLAPTGVPYSGSLSLSGGRHSGTARGPLTIVGNGAVLSGARPVPLTAWRSEGDNIYRFVPVHKGRAMLLRNGEPLPIKRSDDGSAVELEFGEWTTYRGAIYFRHPPGADVFSELSYAAEVAGAVLTNVEYVRIQGVTFQHYLTDGAVVHQLAKNVVFSNCIFRQNARAGLSLVGAGNVLLEQCTFEENVEHSVYVRGSGRVDVVETPLPKPATFVDYSVPEL